MAKIVHTGLWMLSLLAGVAGAQHTQAVQGQAAQGVEESRMVAGTDVPAERARIAREREQELRRQQGVESACYQKFAVTGCLNDSRVQHRAIMADLKRQDTHLNTLERQARGAQQTRRLDEKRAAQQARQDAEAASAGATQQNPKTEAVQREQERLQRQQDYERKQQQHAQEQAQRAQQQARESQEQQRYEQKQQAAREHQRQLEQKAQEREQAGKPPAAPLPAP